MMKIDLKRYVLPERQVDVFVQVIVREAAEWPKLFDCFLDAPLRSPRVLYWVERPDQSALNTRLAIVRGYGLN